MVRLSLKTVVAGVPQALFPALDLLYRTLFRTDSVATMFLGVRGKPLAG